MRRREATSASFGNGCEKLIANKETSMRRVEVNPNRLLPGLFVAASLTLGAGPGFATEQSKQRQDGRDTKQDARQDSRPEKVDCRQENNKSNAACRNDKRDTKQEGRQQARDIKY
jgi:uncharacterized membrane protein